MYMLPLRIFMQFLATSDAKLAKSVKLFKAVVKYKSKVSVKGRACGCVGRACGGERVWSCGWLDGLATPSLFTLPLLSC